jgi:hypothetical protein
MRSQESEVRSQKDESRRRLKSSEMPHPVIPGLPALARHDLLSYIGDFSETRIMNSLILMPGLGQGPGIQTIKTEVRKMITNKEKGYVTYWRKPECK